MADNRTFTLIGQFDDKITSHLNSINSTLNTLKRNLNSFGAKRGGFDDLNKSIGKTVSAHKVLNTEVKSLRGEFLSSIRVMREYRSELGKLAGVKIGLKKASSGMNAEAAYWKNAASAAARYNNTVSKGATRPIRRAPTGGGGGGGGGGGNRPPGGGGGGGGYRGSVIGDVIGGGLITNAIVAGFQKGVDILQTGMSYAFGAFAERAKDQLEDVSAAGGIYSAFKYNKIPGQQAKSFQQAMEMQDSINKDMAAIASNLPGTTHNYVENSRRLVDTTGQVMSKDFKGMMELAKKFTGNQKISMEDAFTSINVEIAKSTTLLEKMNPSKTVVPMTQIVEDMIKKEEVSIAGLRKYVAFRRGTTFEAALQRHIKELNATGQGTAKRLEIINKVLKEAVPDPMIGAFKTSIAGVTEGFRSAFTDPDVGIFGLSRTLFQTITKYNRETGEKMGEETTNFFKMFAETFGNLGNLINTSILPGIAAVYSPFEAMAKDLEKLRDYSFKIFRQQERYTKYFDELAEKFGMSDTSFKTIEKGSLTTVMDILRSFNMLGEVKYDKYAKMMSAKGTEKEIADSMRKIYQDLIPTILNSPFFKNIGKEIGKMLATVFKEIASIMKALLTGKYGVNEFADAFRQAGGMKAVNDIIVLLAEMIGKVVMGIAELYLTSLGTSLKEGNFNAAAVLGVGGLIAAAPLLGPLLGGAAKVGGNVKAAADTAKAAKAAKAADAAAKATRATQIARFGATNLAPAAAAAPGVAGGGAAAAGGVSATGVGALAVLAASTVLFEKQFLGFGMWLRDTGKKLEENKNLIQSSLGFVIKGLGQIVIGTTQFFNGLWMVVSNLLSGEPEKVKAGFKKLFNSVVNIILGIGNTIGGLGGVITTAIFNLFNTIAALITGAEKKAEERNLTNDQAKVQGVVKKDPNTGKVNNNLTLKQTTAPGRVDAKGSPGKQYSTLGGAISSEMRNKPSGSDLVIANSSETVIPAAGGLGMDSLVQAIFGAAQRTASTITQGFTTLTQTTAQGDQSIVSAQKQTAMQTQQTILRTSQSQLAGQQQLMAAIKAGGMGGMPGALGSASVGGGVDAFTGMAAGAGLQLTSGYRPGDPGWHGSNRARDYSNGTGPTPQMLQFARALAAKYGSSLKELIYTPLGFSIKNGQQVAPYAQAAHYNHVHVAYALGAGNPALFPNQKDAVNWENKVSPFNVKSVTSNTGELAGLFDGLFGKKPPELKPGEKPTMNELGTQTGYKMLQRKLETERMMKELNQSNAGPTSINAPITINQQPGQDANALAAIVVAKMSEWVSDARTSSIFV